MACYGQMHDGDGSSSRPVLVWGLEMRQVIFTNIGMWIGVEAGDVVFIPILCTLPPRCHSLSLSQSRYRRMVASGEQSKANLPCWSSHGS
ncbi:hypothetical protein ZEAMMB73_Zm00001d013085 [Zea mays]|uniref:Uncharacterized protein n=1 Tax=Zea mays TaxID=4577 RepID=A0A1D6GFP4_MAIZE|nr:hypothetical protein ZEAMMB73_Zm00001d013085 [Zea mays]